MKYFFIALAVVIVLLLAFGFYLANYSMTIRRQTLEEARKWQADHYDISWYDPMVKKDYVISSYDGYKLHVQFLKNPEKTGKYVIISHGYTDNHIGSLKYTRTWLRLGFNVILYDLRGHGENEVTFCTYSVRESKDLLELIKDTRKRYDDIEVLGIQGESLGSATSIACLKYKPQIDFVVADCGFSEIQSVMVAGLKGMHLPGSFINLASLASKIRYGFWIGEMRPIDSLKDNDIPICFIHGEKDDFILPKHSVNMQKETKGYSELHIIPEATHAASVLFAPEDYYNYVKGFLNKINIKID